MRLTIILLAPFLVFASTCFADSARLAPMAKTVCSNSKEFCVNFVPGKDGVAFKIGKNGQKRELWRIHGWRSAAFLSDDGEHLAACYEGLNLIPQDYSSELVMVSIYDKGKPTHEIRLKNLISDFSALEKTVSHYYWGSCNGLSKNGELRVNTVENKELFINLKTGEVHEK